MQRTPGSARVFYWLSGQVPRTFFVVVGLEGKEFHLRARAEPTPGWRTRVVGKQNERVPLQRGDQRARPTRGPHPGRIPPLGCLHLTKQGCPLIKYIVSTVRAEEIPSKSRGFACHKQGEGF